VGIRPASDKVIDATVAPTVAPTVADSGILEFNLFAGQLGLELPEPEGSNLMVTR
jgi:hypothetical protein